MTNTTTQELAEKARTCFERRKRPSGEEFYCLRDGAPVWLKEALHAAHDNAYEEEFGERAPTDEARACVAMMADVREYMDAYRTGEDDTTEESNQ